ncbi:tyrosine-type recombinase/integrase [Pseudomonas yangonensis]|uniref:tyrosine-type recombinase/integrase n=1 Tax=Pseudomonas yangonensis TaxID=2579922 RepID=UPI001379C3A0|nr:site-specific integrase [Pseudomonas yangonensis]
MPKKAKELSALAVSKLKAEGRYAVGGADGLHLRIAGASRAWVLRLAVGTRVDAKGNTVVHRRDIGLGSYPEVSLAEAREKARELRKQVRDGIDPIEERNATKLRAKLEAAKTKTFEECANAYIEANRAGWKNEKHVQQWQNTLATYAFPKIGQLPVAAIDTGLVLSVLQQETGEDKAQLWHAKTETASRLRGRLESILDWAAFRAYREGENPARWKGHLEHELPARSKVQKVEHHAALPYAELGAFMVELRKREGLSARALEFAILCASRSGEVRGATWAEIDLPGRIWTIPAERMKAGKEHRVPLSDEAVKLLEALPRIVGNPYVFPAPRGGQLSDMALTAVLRRMERGGLTQHGFRSTFRDWAGETTAYPREVCEHALAHKLADGVEAAYQRGDLLAKRARLMADWARYCGTVQGSAENVVAMKKGTA